jgi:16S rRNA (uracil1498-N3)-methyltransferase
MRRFYSPPETFVDGLVTLSPEETRHLRDVLRLRVGDSVNVFDGTGGEFEGAIEGLSKNSSILKIIRPIDPAAPESPLELTLAAAILKSDKFDLVVQKAVELGITRLVPLETTRSESRPRDAVKKAERWRKIALEAAKQCGRAKLMQIDEPLKFSEFVASVEGKAFFFTERGGGKFPDQFVSKKLTAFVGPEGGWDDSEIELARSCGFELITFGGRILRAETAAVSVAAILQHRLGDIN